MINNPSFVATLPYKSTAVALLFSVIFGPVGLLYASFWGGVSMILIGIVVVSSKYFFPILLLWLICCIWSVGAIEAYNQRVLKAHLQKQVDHA
ncbi:MAG: hypothetical protein JO149_00055 [Gammaproteobacteria bacterium]|nr:hypothetical protein [Gammaproteobacteria bacterium]